MTWFKSVVYFSFCIGVIAPVPLPKELKKCPPKDDACLASAIQSALKFLASGSSQLGVVPLEPLFITSMKIPAGNNAVKLEQNFKGIKFHGLTEGKVTSASFNRDDLTLEFVLKSDTSFPVDSKYKFEGKILFFDLNSSGNIKVEFVKATMQHKLKFQVEENRGKKYLKIVEYKLRIHPERITFFLDNLFDGNKQLSDSFLNAVNESWESIYEEVREYYESAFATTFKMVANQFFSRVPMDEIF